MAAAESANRAAGGLLSMVEAPASEGRLELLYRWYPIAIVAYFILTALVSSVRSSGTGEDGVASTVLGPGGKPLPMTKKKRKKHISSRQPNGTELFEIGPRARFIFRLLAVALATTLFMNAAAIAFHTWQANPDLFERGGEMSWWCGEPMVVSGRLSPNWFCSSATMALLHATGWTRRLTWVVLP